MALKSLPHIEGLVGLAHRTGLDIRPTLLRVLTDLYVQKPVHTADEERVYTELSLRLIERVDAQTRATVATLLAGYPAAPTAVMQRLRGGAAAATDFGMRDLGRSPAGSSAELPAISTTSEAFDSGDAETNEPADLNEIFFSADPDERQLILMSLDYSPLMPATPPPAARAEEAIEALETSALARDIPEFTTTLMRILDIPHALAARIASDASGEPMLAAAKAIGMPADVLQRIILFLNPVVGHSVQRVFALARLYDEINAEGALRLVTLWRAGKARRMPQPAHKPLFWDDGRTRPSARESAHPPARRYGARFGDIAEERRNFSARSGR